MCKTDRYRKSEISVAMYLRYRYHTVEQSNSGHIIPFKLKLKIVRVGNLDFLRWEKYSRKMHLGYQNHYQ